TADAETKTLTLQQAIEIAKQSNINLKQASNQINLGAIAVNRTRGNFLPDVSLSSQSSKRYGKQYNVLTDSYEGRNTGSLSLGLSASYNIFNGFYDTASLQQAKIELKSMTENLERTRQTLVFQTIQNFIQVITAREVIKVAQENLEAQQLLMSQIEEYYKSGKRPVTDFYQQKAQVSNAEFQLVNARSAYDISKLRLTQTLGLEPNTDVEVVDPGMDAYIAHVMVFHEGEIVKEALTKRLDVNAQRLLIDAAWQQIKAAKSGYWPTLSFSAGVDTDYSSLVSYSDFSNQFFKNNPSGFFGLSLAVPIFDRYRTRYNVASAQVNRKSQELDLAGLQQQVSLEVQQAISDYQTGIKQMDVTDTQLKYSKDALDSMQERYNVNAATLVELTQTRAQYVQAVYNRIQAKYNVLVRGIAVAYYKGDANAMVNWLNTK
ncbi:MAG: TolC family protein, partial [Candidatus Omnitrophota bacterium]